MSELVEFLLARIEADEKVARDFIDEGPWQDWAREDFRGPGRDDEYAQLNIGAARVLAECEAKRRIVEELSFVGESPEWANDMEMSWGWEAGWAVLTALAFVHADHPDYDPTWRP